MRKRIGKCLLLAVCMVALSTALAGCSSTVADTQAEVETESGQEVSSVEDVVQSQVSEEETASVEVEQTITQTEEESVTEETQEIQEEVEVDRTPAFELLAQMNIGWNLGNSLDSHGRKGGIADETAWGNPATTKEMIDEIAKQGFNTIRIPVTWSDHMGAAPDYIVEEVWMNRVKEVVQYAIDADLYVILDTHHEPAYWLIPEESQKEAVGEQLAALWKQIAEAFQEYDEKLIFEGMNEPRVIGSAKEWNGGTAEEREVVNELNQIFIDTVRATGGNNENRCLIICTYGNCAERQAVVDLKIPADANIAVALHMYTPYDFTFAASNNSISVWDGSRTKDITSTLTYVNELLIQDGAGVPVIITEFGAENKDNNTQEVIKWLDDYLGAMNEYGIKCVWWDNNVYTQNGEKFGIFNRNTRTWYAPEVADALVKER